MTTIAANPACARCRYDLAVLPGDGVCPECGFSIADSIDPHRNDVRPLEYASRGHLVELLLGAAATSVGFIALFIAAPVAYGSWLLGSRASYFEQPPVVAVACFTALLLGSWLVTARNGGFPESARVHSRRYLIRATAALGPLAYAAFIHFQHTPLPDAALPNILDVAVTMLVLACPMVLVGLLLIHGVCLTQPVNPNRPRDPRRVRPYALGGVIVLIAAASIGLMVIGLTLMLGSMLGLAVYVPLCFELLRECTSSRGPTGTSGTLAANGGAASEPATLPLHEHA